MLAFIAMASSTVAVLSHAVSSGHPSGEPCPVRYPGHQHNDHCAGQDATVHLFELNVTASPLTRSTFGFGDKEFCSSVTYRNPTKFLQPYGEIEWFMQPPGSFPFFQSALGGTLELSSGLAAGGLTTGTACFTDGGQHGQFVLFWRPDSNEGSARGIWLFNL
jgi:hypothetical protein